MIGAGVAQRTTLLSRQREIESREDTMIATRLRQLLAQQSTHSICGLKGSAAQEGFDLLRQAPNACMRYLLNHAAPTSDISGTVGPMMPVLPTL